MYEDRKEVGSWVCLLDPADGSDFVKVPKAINTSNVISGETTLFAPGVTVVKDQIAVDSPSDVIFGDARRRDRHLYANGTLGTMEVVVVRITCGTNSVTKSLVELKEDVFDDEACLKSQMKGCSNGALKVARGPNDGGFEIQFPTCFESEGWLRENTTAAVATFLGVQSMDTYAASANIKFLYCMPPNIGMGPIAYAWAPYWLSVYNNEWCSYVSAQMHEVGHNLNLAHAREANEEYGDTTGFMGYSYKKASTCSEKLCGRVGERVGLVVPEHLWIL